MSMEWRYGQLMDDDKYEQKYAEWCELQRLEDAPRQGLLTSWGGIAFTLAVLISGLATVYGFWWLIGAILRSLR